MGVRVVCLAQRWWWWRWWSVSRWESGFWDDDVQLYMKSATHLRRRALHKSVGEVFMAAGSLPVVTPSHCAGVAHDSTRARHMGWVDGVRGKKVRGVVLACECSKAGQGHTGTLPRRAGRRC